MELNSIIAAIRQYKNENGEWPEGYLEVLPNGKIKKAQSGKKTKLRLGVKEKKDKKIKALDVIDMPTVFVDVDNPTLPVVEEEPIKTKKVKKTTTKSKKTRKSKKTE